MKKKALLILLLITAVFTLSACKKDEGETKKEEQQETKKEIVIKDEDFGTTTLSYDENKDYEVTQEKTGRYNTTTIVSKKENFELELYHTDSVVVSWNELKEDRSSKNGYKEYSWNKLEGYSYDGSKYSIRFNVKLATSDNNVKVLFGEMRYESYEDADVLNTFNSSSVQDLLNSITFKE